MDVEQLVRTRPTALGPLLPGAEPLFRADRVRGGGVPRGGGDGLLDGWDARFAVVVAVCGSGRLVTAAGGEVALERGATVLVPHAAGAVTVDGAVELVVCRPPLPD